ncbi:hypothetical protein HPP92_001426 [Vanilla planifolia]|uniref:RING-type E3 ubiquitin transferase n=1 Tax=Vanilla planifolia TaxID=51239 RepID=A0A835VHZ0_VANPL|nr:hypothetical protein HPP92_001426 [Vanilla planifolia]
MGQNPSCRRPSIDHDFSSAVRSGDLKFVQSILQKDPEVLRRNTSSDRDSPYHIAAAYGHVEILSVFLDQSDIPDTLNKHKQTPLMVAAMQGKISCVEKLLHTGANILMFDSVNERTCLHHAAYYGHSDCLEAILQAASHSKRISASWGVARFVNLRDSKGLTSLHLAAKQGKAACLRLLLDSGALIDTSTGFLGSHRSAPLHLAARRGSLDCVCELLARGADRLQMDSIGRTPYAIALRRNHFCAALLNPSSEEPLVWPSRLRIIVELEPSAKLLLETALVEANRQRQRIILNRAAHAWSPTDLFEESVVGVESHGGNLELCCICFDRACSIEVQDCGHRMCAHCTLALCCLKKSYSSNGISPPPACPFCRCKIASLVATKKRGTEEEETEYSSKEPLRLTDTEGSIE